MLPLPIIAAGVGAGAFMAGDGATIGVGAGVGAGAFIATCVFGMVGPGAMIGCAGTLAPPAGLAKKGRFAPPPMSPLGPAVGAPCIISGVGPEGRGEASGPETAPLGPTRAP
jgi:hypothetical protein